jgi:hypothetical protein
MGARCSRIRRPRKSTSPLPPIRPCWTRGAGNCSRCSGRPKPRGGAVAPGRRSLRRTAKRVVLAATKRGKDPLERIAAAHRQLSTRAPQVLPRVPRVVAQVSGTLGARRRHGPARAAAAMGRLRAPLEQTAGWVRRVIPQNAERFQGHHIPDKVLRLPAPHVVSIRTGKRAKGTEYGSKGSLAMDRHGVVITHTEYASNLAARTGRRPRPASSRTGPGAVGDGPGGAGAYPGQGQAAAPGSRYRVGQAAAPGGRYRVGQAPVTAPGAQ